VRTLSTGSMSSVILGAAAAGRDLRPLAQRLQPRLVLRHGHRGHDPGLRPRLGKHLLRPRDGRPRRACPRRPRCRPSPSHQPRARTPDGRARRHAPTRYGNRARVGDSVATAAATVVLPAGVSGNSTSLFAIDRRGDVLAAPIRTGRQRQPRFSSSSNSTLWLVPRTAPGLASNRQRATIAPVRM
jgi:hypothetical protein